MIRTEIIDDTRHEGGIDNVYTCISCIVQHLVRFYRSILLRLHRSFEVSIGLDEASCRQAGGSYPGCTSALSAERRSTPGNKITAQKLLSTQDV